MKKILILVQVIGLTILMACTSGGGTPEQPYTVKSGIVTYKPMEMMGVKVNQTLYFDEYGKKEMRETKVEGNMMGMEMRQHTIDIRDGNIVYHYELENMSGGQNIATKEAIKQTLTPDILEQINIQTMTKELKAKFNYKEEGKETVAGKEGTKYTLTPDSTNTEMRITGVHFKNIPLKFSNGQMEIIAEKVETGVSIAADKFKVPAGYKIIDESAQKAAPSMGSDAQAPADTSSAPAMPGEGGK